MIWARIKNYILRFFYNVTFQAWFSQSTIEAIPSIINHIAFFWADVTTFSYHRRSAWTKNASTFVVAGYRGDVLRLDLGCICVYSRKRTPCFGRCRRPLWNDSLWASLTGLTAVSKFKPRLLAKWAVGTHRNGPGRIEKVTSRRNRPMRNSIQICN